MADHARTLSPDSPPVVVGSAGDVQAFQDRAATRPSDLRIVGRIAADEHEAQGPRAFTDRVPLVGRVGRLRDAAAQVELRRGTSGAFIHLHPRRLDLPQLAIKRTMDVIVAAGALVAVAPLLAAVALAIKFDSRGPVLFRQTRIGVGGRRFQILKFRTMGADADRQKASLAHLNGYPDARLLRDQARPAHHAPGPLPAPDIARRAATALERAARRDEHGRTPPVRARGVRARRPAPHGAAFRGARRHGPWQVSGRNTVLDFDEVYSPRVARPR